MTRRTPLQSAALVAAAVIVVMAAGGYLYRAWRHAAPAGGAEEVAKTPIVDGAMPIRVSAEARKNMGLVAKSLQPTNCLRKIEVPGVITDRPGVSDRGVVAPVTGIVTKIHAYPGNTVLPDSPLFSLRLVSESLHASQLELFKASKEIERACGSDERYDRHTGSKSPHQKLVSELA